MSKSTKSTESITGIARRARAAGRVLAALPAETRNAILIAVASSIETASDEILVANERDCDRLKDEVLSGRVSQAFFDRLRTSASGVVDMAAKVRAVAELPDPIARTLAVTVLSENLTLHKITCPLGVIGIIFESRPDVIPQISALCVKSGNAGGAQGRKGSRRHKLSTGGHLAQGLVRIWFAS
jgi:glutamate-5-semialdehyde dehydrogenase